MTAPKHRTVPGMSELQKRRSSETHLRHGHGGVKRSKEYRAWAHIIGRCHNRTDKSFYNYGGRGIAVHQAWRDDFANFLADVGLAPSPQHTLDRIDNDGNYEPGNVRWATRADQQRNTRRTVIVDGLCLKDACLARGVSYEAAQMRIRRGQLPSLAVAELEAKKCA